MQVLDRVGGSRIGEPLVNPQESMVNDDPRFLELFEPGTVAHQGDLIIISLKSLPKSVVPRTNRQLAEGNTQGSRHILTRGELYDAADKKELQALIKEATGCEVQEQYLGPVFVSPDEPTAGDLSHPEHGAQGYAAGSICATVYQRNLDAEEREARVRD